MEERRNPCLESEYPRWVKRYRMVFPHPGSLIGQTGSPRKLAEAKNPPNPPYHPNTSGSPSLELRVSVPALPWGNRKPAEAKNGIIPPMVRIFPRNTALGYWVGAPDAPTWEIKELTISNAISSPIFITLLLQHWALSYRICQPGESYGLS